MRTVQIPVAARAVIFPLAIEQLSADSDGVSPDASVTVNAVATSTVSLGTEPAATTLPASAIVATSVLRSAFTGEKTVGQKRMYAGLALSRPAPSTYRPQVVERGLPVATRQSTDSPTEGPAVGFGLVP